jgi:MFS family permease
MTSTPSDAVNEQQEKLRGRDLALLIALCAAFFLDALDTSMVAVALPSIQHELHMSTANLQWVVSGYVLGYGGFLLLGGRAADLLGRRRVFLIALAGFFAMSALGGIATDGTLLIASRFAKGIAAGFTAPACLAIILSSFPEGPLRNRALAAYSTTGAAGFTFGLISGGLLSEVNWRLVFFMPTLLAGLTLVLATRVIPRDTDSGSTRARIDIPGAIAVTSAMLLLVYTLTEAPGVGWATPRTLLSLVGVGALLVAFVLVEQRHSAPLMPLHLLSSWVRVRANLGAMSFVGGWACTQFLATLYMQDLRGWSALETAGAFWPCGLLGVLVAPKIAAAVKRCGVHAVMAVGFAMTVVAYALFLSIGLHSQYWLALFPTFALIGIAFALCYSTLSIAATDGVAPADHGVASGLFQASAQFGTALLVAVVTAVSQAVGNDSSPAGVLHGYQAALRVPLIACAVVLALVIPAAARRQRARSAAISMDLAVETGAV